MSRKDTTAHKKLKNWLKTRHYQSVERLLGKHQRALMSVANRDVPMGEIGTTTARMLGAGVLSGALLLGPVNVPQLSQPDQLVGPKALAQVKKPVNPASKPLPEALSRQLISVLPSRSGVLTQNQEDQIVQIIKSNLHINSSAALNGNRLNTAYGYMGYEQHLRRFPGDSASQHDEFVEDGMASREGAWGYFASDAALLTDELVAQEKYYFAVQTFISPGWQDNLFHLKDWFKYRKMIAINPKTGQAVVGVVADAGPAVWTGKQFGGSPEVMHGLSLDRGMRNGEVLLFFVDDPSNEVPLGPIN